MHVELEEDCSLEQLKDVFLQSPVIALEEKQEDLTIITPVTCAELDDRLFVGRIRKVSRATFEFTVVMDNTRHGEAKAALDLLTLLQPKLG